LALIGLIGAIYIVVVARRMKIQRAYRPEFEDWLFFVVLPLVAYAALPLSAFAAFSHGRESLFGVGAATLVLLFLGIRNSWDSISYHVFHSSTGKEERRADEASENREP